MLTGGKFSHQMVLMRSLRSVASAPATSVVLMRKYRNANANIGAMSDATSAREIWPGIAWETKKNVLLEHHRAIAGAVALNSTRIGGRLDRFIQSEITSASRTTVTTPAGVPNSRTDVKTKVSETEIFAASEGTLTVNEPVRSVRVASRNHSTPG